MNWLVNSSFSHSWPKPAVCVEASTRSVLITPSSSVTYTMTSPPPKPFTVTVFASAGISSVASGSAGASVVSGSAAASSSSVIAGASSAALMASTAAVEVTVALASASTPSPKVNGPLLPMNCAVNSSPAQRVPMPSVCVLASMTTAETVPSSLSVKRATTSPPPKPDALP